MSEGKAKKNIIDGFVEGARDGFNMSAMSMAPNVIFAFALIQMLNLTGLTDVIGKVFGPLMSIFKLPGVAATVLMASLFSTGGGVGAAASLAASGQLGNSDIAILLPAIMLMGALLQYTGRCLGTAGVKSKYYVHFWIIAIINAILAMLIMGFFV